VLLLAGKGDLRLKGEDKEGGGKRAMGYGVTAPEGVRGARDKKG